MSAARPPEGALHRSPQGEAPVSTALQTLLARPVVAILRGVQPDEVVAVADVLMEAGFTTIEVPLNSPQPLQSIERLAAHCPHGVLVGAGTVLRAADVDACAAAGARLVLAPNLNPLVVQRAVALGLAAMPGVATPSEGFAALEAGAQLLKVFPADVLGTASIKAWRSVFPAGTAFFAVGGIGADNMAAFRQAGAAGVGLGSSLYAPGIGLEELRTRARRMLAAWSGA